MRCRLRARLLCDNRRMSYKGLNDRQKQRALLPFLEAADQIPGFLVSIAVEKAISTLFEAGGEAPDLAIMDAFDLPAAVFEKTLRIIHFVSFFSAGISSEGQDVLWFTDEDAIVANPERLELFTNIWGNVVSHYLRHNLRHLRCGTTKSDDGSNSIEDLAAIPDLAAGALCDLMPEIVTLSRSGIIAPLLRPSKQKASVIGRWLSDGDQPLKRLNLVLSRRADSGGMTLTTFRFHDLSEFNRDQFSTHVDRP
jgi:hypothetical protein